MVDKWRKKYGFIDTEVDFDFHLCEDDVQDHGSLVDGVRILTIDQTKVEFGFEDQRMKGQHKVMINFGFGGVLIGKEDFEKALMHYRLKELGMDELKRERRKKDDI